MPLFGNPSSGAALTTVQAAAATGPVAAWSSLLTITAATATTQTLPNAALGAVGQSLTLKNLGAGTVTIAPFAGNSITGSVPTLATGDSATFQVSAVGVVQLVSFRLGTAVSPDLLSPWAASSPVFQYSERSTTIGGTTVALLSGSTRTTGTSYSLTEALNWSYTAQSTVPPFPASSVVMQGYQIVDSGLTYQANATRVTGSAFDATELAQWTALSVSASGNRVNLSNFAASAVVGTAPATVDVASILTFNQTTAGISVSLPNPTNALAHKTLTLENLSTATQSVIVTAGETLALDPGMSRLVQWNGTDWRVLSAANLVAETVGPNYATSSTINVTGATAATAVDVASITLPSAGKWQIQWTVRGNNNGVANVFVSTVLTDSANSVLPNSEVLATFLSSGSVQGSGSGAYFVTTTGPATYKVRAYSASGSGYVYSDINGRSFVLATKVSGLLPVTGQTVEYINVKHSVAQVLAANAPFLFDTVIGGSMNRPTTAGFTLTAGKTYRMEGNPGGSNGTAGLLFQWRDITNNVFISSAAVRIPPTGGNTNSLDYASSVAIYTPTTNVVVQLWAVNGSTTSWGQGSPDSVNSYSYANIVQIGSSALSGIAAPSLSRVAVSTAVAAVIGGAVTVYVDASLGARLITLPLASASANMVVSIKKVDGSANAVTVARSGTDTIDGATSFNLTAQYDSNDFRADSTNAFWGIH